MLARLFLVLCAFAFSPLYAQAATGIVVRLVTGGDAVESPVVAILTNKEGVEHRAPLADNGEAPDVNPGDHHYSGSTMLDGDAFTVSISLGDDIEEVGEVSWPTNVTARDLVITRYDGIVTLETGAGDNNQPNGQPSTGAAGAADVGSTPAPVAANSGNPPTPVAGNAPMQGMGNARAPAVSFASSDTPGQMSDDSTLYVIGGILLLVLAGVAFFWFRPEEGAGQNGGYVGADQAHKLPEPGLLGEGSPSLSDGPSVWVVDPADTNDFLGLLLSSMAAHHRVLVVAPGSDPLPLVHGGPVFRMKNPRPSHVSDALDALGSEAGQSFSVLIRATEMNAKTVTDYCELLPPNVGTVIIVSGPHEGPEQQVSVSREGSGWMLKTAACSVKLIMNDWGLSTSVIVPKAKEA